MFTVKQTWPTGEKMWPSASCVDTSKDEMGRITLVTALFDAGGLLDFRPGSDDQTIYVMNENGSTVGKFLLIGDGKIAASMPPLTPTPL